MYIYTSKYRSGALAGQDSRTKKTSCKIENETDRTNKDDQKNENHRKINNTFKKKRTSEERQTKRSRLPYSQGHSLIAHNVTLSTKSNMTV